jgi:hypothetical protein
VWSCWQDFPDVFTRLVPEVMHCSQATMEKGISDNLFVDYRKKGSFFECTSISAIKDIMCDKVKTVFNPGKTYINLTLPERLTCIYMQLNLKVTNVLHMYMPKHVRHLDILK